MKDITKMLISIILVEMIIIAGMGWIFLDYKNNDTSDSIENTIEKLMLEITLEKKRYSIGSPIEITATLTNNMQSTINLTSMDVLYSLSIFLVLPNYTVIIGHGNDGQGGEPTIIPEYWTMKPNEMRNYTCDLMDLDYYIPYSQINTPPLSISEIGTYYVWSRYSGYDFPNELINSNVVEIEIYQ